MKYGKEKIVFLYSKAILVILFIFAVTGTVFAGQTIDEVRSKWIGVSINKLIEKHGYPDQSFTAPNGNTVYVVIKNVRKLYPVPVFKQPDRKEVDMYNTKTGAYSYGTTTTGGGWTVEQQMQKSECAGYFEVNKDKIIVEVKFKGDECPQ
ncbi:MAG: hypothetical protein Q8M56_14170 [Desulfobacterales bacterium]|jgi:hypothetical protein|nr:hypothetical protein [Desulfobacterales bacterium]